MINSFSPSITLMVGNQEIKNALAESIQANGALNPIELDPVAKKNGTIEFVRDARVIGLNHRQLIPHAINDPFLIGRFAAHIPLCLSHFILNSQSAHYGKGFTQIKTAEAISYAQNQGLPFNQMRACIEGGNCYVFYGKDNEPKAIVGLCSLVLTCFALEEQGYFQENAIPSIDSPSEDSFRIARNRELYYSVKRVWDRRFDKILRNNAVIKGMRLHFNAEIINQLLNENNQERAKLLNELEQMFGNELRYRQYLTKPLSKEDKAKYLNEACLWEAKMLLAKQVIYEDLGVKKIAFVPQKHFHIDMEMFVFPSSAFSNGEDKDIVYVDNKSYHPSLIEVLQEIGCDVISLPGINGTTNFMNGVFVSTASRPLFLSNGYRSRNDAKVAEIFKQALQNTKANFNIDFVGDNMQNFLADYRGGIHCLTWEKLNYSTPVDIVLSYLSDEPISSKIRQPLLQEFFRI